MSADVTEAAAGLPAKATVLEASAPIRRRVRGYFAPVDRASGTPTGFDVAALAGSGTNEIPAPWIDLGVCLHFVRRSGTKIEAVRSGAPATARQQVRTEIDATVEFQFERWGKLQLALSAGVQQMNLLARDDQGATLEALSLGAGGGVSTATTLAVGVAQAGEIAVGTMVAVDLDYTGELGYVGSGASGGYVSSNEAIGQDSSYLRRVTLNVGVVADVAEGVLTLARPLPAGVPSAGMKVSRVVGFSDREGDRFFQEWSGLFCLEGEQGDRVFYYYPRLQATGGAAEQEEALSGSLLQVRLKGSYRALATRDEGDGSRVLCYRSYVPAPFRMV